MKKPPYRVYKKEKEEPKVPIPEKIDTPQAEQLVSDLYSLLHFLEKHKEKILLFILAFLIIGGTYGGYTWYLSSVESKAAKIVDRGIYYLEKGKENKAISLFEKAIKEYPKAPSSRLAEFLAGKLQKKEDYLTTLSKGNDFLFSPPSKTSLGAIYIDKNRMNQAESVLETVKRDQWTHPEALYNRLLIAIEENRVNDARNILDTLRGDYGNLPITQLAEELLR